MYILCEDFDEGYWEAICVSDDRDQLECEAFRLNELDYEKCLKRHLSDPRWPKPIELNNPLRRGYMKFYVHEVPVWPERLS